MALYGARRGSQGVPQSMVGFLSANPTVVAVANVGAWVGAAMLLWQGGSRAYKASTYIYHNSIKSWIQMEREKRSWMALCLSEDIVLLLAYLAKRVLQLLLTVFQFVLIMIAIMLMRFRHGDFEADPFGNVLLRIGQGFALFLFVWSMLQGFWIYSVMDKVLKLRDYSITSKNEQSKWEV